MATVAGDNLDDHPAQGSFAQEIFDCHNIVRCLNGQSAVEWDSDLASRAVGLSSHGILDNQHSVQKNNHLYGEILTYGGGKAQCLKYWEEAIIYTDERANKTIGQTGHFTTMTWSTIKKMGCGQAEEKSGGGGRCLYDAVDGSVNMMGEYASKVKQGCTGRSQDQCEKDPKINPLGQAAFSLPRDIFCGAEGKQQPEPKKVQEKNAKEMDTVGPACGTDDDFKSRCGDNLSCLLTPPKEGEKGKVERCNEKRASNKCHCSEAWRREFWDEPISQVNCGGHEAETCEKCSGDIGKNFCNGDCEWKNDKCSDRS